MYIYIYIYICISGTALCAFGVTGFSTLLSDVCSLVLSAFLLIGAPPNPDGRQVWKNPTLVGRLRKSFVLLQVLVNIHYFALWIHHIIHVNYNCCSTSNVLFTFSFSCKSIIFKCSFKYLTTCKCKTSGKRQGLRPQFINLGVKIHLPK